MNWIEVWLYEHWPRFTESQVDIYKAAERDLSCQLVIAENNVVMLYDQLAAKKLELESLKQHR